MRKKEHITLPTIAMLGAGSMAKAILSGLMADHVTHTSPIRLTNNTQQQALTFQDTPGVVAWSVEETPDANIRAVTDADIVFIAVKPAKVVTLLDEIAPALKQGAVVVSVAAGITTQLMEQHLPDHVSVIRTMPNTPAQIGLGVTGLCSGSKARKEDLAVIVQVMETTGDVIVIEESLMDALGSISGSGPAYVYYFIEQFIKVAIERGFTPEQAKTMVQGTFRGALELLETTHSSPEELRKQVTSPQGSTEKAIAVFDQEDIHHIILSATAAAIARSQEMAEGK